MPAPEGAVHEDVRFGSPVRYAAKPAEPCAGLLCKLFG